QRRLAGAVRPDDRVGLALFDLQVDVGQRPQAAEVLEHIRRVEDDIGGWRVHCPYALSPTSARFGRKPRSQRTSRWLPSTSPPGRKTTISTNNRPSVRCQPSPTNFDRMVTVTPCMPSGRNSTNELSVLMLIAEKMFSKYLISQAPTTGPQSVPTPPRMVISTRLPDSVHRIRSAPAIGSVTASRPPARPANMPEMTKAASI